MIATPAAIPEVLVIEPKVYEDDRGFFFESFNEAEMRRLGITERFVQDNHSRSVKNVLRGLHYQICQPQGKLVRVVSGEIFDVAVDLRCGSPTFGKWVAARLSDRNRRMLWVPSGFAHGFLGLTDNVEVLYKASDFYAPVLERTILWNDPDLAIDWPLAEAPLVSPKDLRGVPLKRAEVFREQGNPLAL